VSYDGSPASIEEIKCFKSDVTPYIIKQNSVKNGVPSRDLILSPDHKVNIFVGRKDYTPTKRDRMRSWKRIQSSPYASLLETPIKTHTYYHIRTSTRKPIRVSNILVETLGGNMMI
jgi:hypothetical protein